jgi:quercetin dioxygenase-like cupin family protein
VSNGGPSIHPSVRSFVPEVDAVSQPFIVSPGEGHATWTDSLNVFKALSKDTGGALALWESLIPQGSSPPLHVHEREDEGFYVLDGEMTFRMGDQFLEALTGAFLWGPRDVPHQWRVNSATARLLTFYVPAGGEGLFFEMSRPAEARTLPSPLDGPAFGPTAEQLVEWEQRYGGRIVGPPMAPE